MKLTKFEKLFDGLNLTKETQRQIAEAFDDAVESEVERRKKEEVEEEENRVADEPQTVVPDTSDSILQFLRSLRTDPELLRVIRPYDRDDVETTVTDIQMSFRRMLERSRNIKQDDIALKFIFTIFGLIADNQTVANAIARALQKPGQEETLPPEDEEKPASPVISEKMINAVDSYLSYITEEWMKENRLSVENGIRSELVESFMVGLKNLYRQHAIEVPDSIDVVEKLNEKLDVLEEKLNRTLENNILLKEELNNEKKNLFKEQTKQIFLKRTADMPKTKVEDLSVMTENLEFNTVKEYEKKLSILIENMNFANRKTVLEEEVVAENDKNVIAVDSRVDEYSKKLSILNSKK